MYKKQRIFNITNLSTNADKAYDVFTFADIDNDGDLDIISASYEDDKIDLYEKMEQPSFHFLLQQLLAVLDGATSVFVADIDNDGDLDMISSSNRDDKIAWYEIMVLPIPHFLLQPYLQGPMALHRSLLQTSITMATWT